MSPHSFEYGCKKVNIGSTCRRSASMSPHSFEHGFSGKSKGHALGTLGFNATALSRIRIRPCQSRISEKSVRLQCHRTHSSTDLLASRGQKIARNALLQCHRTLSSTDTRPGNPCFTLTMQRILPEAEAVRGRCALPLRCTLFFFYSSNRVYDLPTVAGFSITP